MSSEESLQRRMEYMQDVGGWKSIIFIPFHPVWQIVVVFSILYSYVMSTYLATYHMRSAYLIYVFYLSDFLYLVDVFCSVLHHMLKKVRQTKNFLPRPLLMLLVDFLSLIPLEWIFSVIYIPKEKNEDSWYYMFFNRCIRIYRFYFYFIGSKTSTKNIKYSFVISFAEFSIYGYCVSHLATCLFYILKSEEEKALCKDGTYKCILINEMITNLFLTGHFIGNERIYNTWEKRLISSVFLTGAHFYVYGFMAPMCVFSCMKRYRTFFEFWNRFKRLDIFLSNMIPNEALKKKTLDEFRTVWTYGKGNVEPELMKSFPMNLKKDTYSDVYWDILRHSELLQNVSYSCKRSLALNIIGDFYMPDTTFWDLGENKNSIIYISSGIMQIMSAENKKSPIMSFSGGTILGESTIFYPGRSKAILRVATFSEIHVLNASDFFRVIQDYPNDRKIVRRNLNLRLNIAKMTQIRKKEISKVIFNRNTGEIGDFTVEEDDSVKWIKTQCREIAVFQGTLTNRETEQTDSKSMEIMKHMNEMKTGINHTSIYLPLLNLGEDIEVLTDVTCLKTTIPWVIDPNSHFIRHWRQVILISVLFCSVIYPLSLAWSEELPSWLLTLSEFISIFYLVDIIVQISTAVKTKDIVILRSGAIFRYRLKSLSFYADIVSALPYQLLIQYLWSAGRMKQLYLRVTIALTLLKIYRIIDFLNEWCHTLKGKLSLRVMIQYSFLFIAIIYLSSALLHVVDVRCLFQTCDGKSWYKVELEKQFPHYKTLASTFFALTYLLGASSPENYDHSFNSAIIILTTSVMSQVLLLEWFGDYCAAYTFEMSQEVKFRMLIQSVTNFLNDRNIVGRVKKRVLDTLYFHWHYDCGDYITQERAMLDDAPSKLKRDVNKATTFKVLKSCDIFHFENDAFIWYLCQQGQRLPLPANSIVLTFGIQTMTLYVVYKGYLQINSFLPRDIMDGMASAILYGPGKILPLVVALNQMPCGLTARTITDCELIAIRLEDLLTGLILNNSFKDFVEAIKTVDLEPFINSKLTLSKVTNAFKVHHESYNAPFAKLWCRGWYLKIFLMRTFVNGEGPKYLRWEIFRLFCLGISASCWPIVFALVPSISRRYLIYALLGIDFLSLIDFYIKMHIGFYNKMGIYVTHPLNTSWRYITTSFLPDLIFFAPSVYNLYVLLHKPSFKMTHSESCIICVIKLLGLSRIYLFISNYERIRSESMYVRFFGYTCMLLILLNCFILLKMRTEIRVIDIVDGSPVFEFADNGWIKEVDIPNLNSLFDIYLVMMYCVTMLVLRSFPVFQQYSSLVLLYRIIFPFLGFVLVYFGHGFVISRMAGSKMNLTIYQYHMKALTRFLKVEKADDSISMMAINHFEHEWEKTQGEDLHKVFSRFPNILEEDLMFPIYRRTLVGVPCFKNANTGFYRTLSRTFIEVHFRKGSIITFEKGVHKDIYFVHKGQCQVHNRDIILRKGSVMGDIKGKGLMLNNISALTHVVLLTIKSPKFFLILNNFYQTEKAFFEAVEKVEDFMESNYKSRTSFVAKNTENWAENPAEMKECTFELADEKSKDVFYSTKKGKTEKTWEIHPKSNLSNVLSAIFVIVAVLTSFTIPIIIALRLATWSALTFMYILDAVWVIKIITTLRTSFISEETGNIVTSSKEIFKNYIRSFDGFITDILSVLPFEYVYVLITKENNDGWKRYCYALRLMRLLSLWILVAKGSRKLSVGDRTRWGILILRQIILYNLFTAINLLLATAKEMKIEENQYEYSKELWDILLWGYFTMFNLFSGAGIYIFPPKNLLQIIFYIFISAYSFFERCKLTSEVLSIINVSRFMKSEKLNKMQIMETYWKFRDVSPALRKSIMSYAGDLLHFETDVTPFFLETAPYFIKVQIMQDLYIQYLLRCPTFYGLHLDFLKQLAARLERHIHFPSDIIAVKGDVDRCMYFVHRGELVSVESDPHYFGLDYETRRFTVGDVFGIKQGLGRSIPHSTTYRATTKVELLSLKFTDWEDLRLSFPEIIPIIRKNMETADYEEGIQLSREHRESYQPSESEKV